MITCGLLSFIFGAAISIFGMVSYNTANSAGYGLNKYFDSSDMDTSRLLIVFGIVLIVLGVTLLIAGSVQSSNKNSYISKSNNRGYNKGIGNQMYCVNYKNDYFNTQRKCLKCGNIISSNHMRFCSKCGTPLDN